MEKLSKAIVFLATEFEEIEASTIIDILRRGKVEVTVVGLDTQKVQGAHNIKFIPDTFIEEINLKDFDAVILPGGSPGYKNLKKNKIVLNTIKEAFYKNKLVAAICAAPAVLAKAGILKGKNCTIYPGMEIELKKGGGIPQNNWVVVDGNIIISQGPATALLFSILLVEKLTSVKMEEQLREKTLTKLVLKQNSPLIILHNMKKAVINH